jgi:predicted NACHT family NTPase/transcriptional regulator with XRE-family HTH domain
MDQSQNYKPQKSREFGVALRQLLQQRALSDRQFAKRCGLDTSYISKLLNGEIAEPRRTTLEKLAQGLSFASIDDLYQEIQRLNLGLKPVSEFPGFISPYSDLDSFIQNVRLQLRKIIINPNSNVGTMRMLGLNRPVLVDDNIYVDLNVLEQLSCNSYFSQWRKEYEPGSQQMFDRLGIGIIKQNRVAAISTIKKYSQVFLLGKPGAGKSTFLRSLAVKCIQSDTDFFPERVPIFVTLREFAREAHNTKSWNLVGYLMKMLEQQGCSAANVQTILEHGRSLLLLDGLDEVSQGDLKAILKALQELIDKQNHLVITCRTQGQWGIDDIFWKNFVELELADFTPEQTSFFIMNWFNVVIPEDKGVLACCLIQELHEVNNKVISDLAVTPVLLNLICAVFRDEQGNLPQKRSALYSKGMRLLLERLRRSPVIEQLTFHKKEEFLAALALKLFADNDYFPTEQNLMSFIQPYFKVNHSNASKILKAIETETGLLIERSSGYWSFSHLTFHEYFAAQAICSIEKSKNLEMLQQLVKYMLVEQRWREVIFLTIEMIGSTDELFCLMKQQSDQMLANNRKLQDFLAWMQKKARSLDAYNESESAYIRAFFHKREHQECCPHENIEALCDVIKFNKSFQFNYICDHPLICDLVQALTIAFDYVVTNARRLESDFYQMTVLAGILDSNRNFVYDLAFEFSNENLDKNDIEIKLKLNALYSQLPDFNLDFRAAIQWWQENECSWTVQLHSIMTQHCNGGHDYQFTDRENNLLQQYYDANKILVECLSSSCNVSQMVQQEIGASLLLPIADIEKRNRITPIKSTLFKKITDFFISS